MDIGETLYIVKRSDWRKWLREHYKTKKEIWLVYYKAGSGKPRIEYNDAVEEALCFGWIDGLIKRIDESRYVKFFSPRRAGSRWSEKNKLTAEKLIQSNRMTPPGRQAIERAKRNGTWNRENRPTFKPEDVERFAKMIAPYPMAAVNYEKMPPSFKKLFAGYYFSAKQNATQVRRLQKLVVLLEQNKRPML